MKAAILLLVLAVAATTSATASSLILSGLCDTGVVTGCAAETPLASNTADGAMSFYELVAAEGGAKMTHNVAEQLHPKYKHATGISVFAQRMTMPRLADMLSNVAGKPVVDKTDLTGTFAIALQTRTAIPSEASTPDPGDDAPDVFRAIQEQLGLKLRPAKGALDVLVIDSIGRTPTAN